MGRAENWVAEIDRIRRKTCSLEFSHPFRTCFFFSTFAFNKYELGPAPFAVVESNGQIIIHVWSPNGYFGINNSWNTFKWMKIFDPARQQNVIPTDILVNDTPSFNIRSNISVISHKIFTYQKLHNHSLDNSWYYYAWCCPKCFLSNWKHLMASEILSRFEILHFLVQGFIVLTISMMWRQYYASIS